jgi:homoserine O-acetyltransferase
MDAIMPLASLPVEIAGRNRMQRDGSKAYWNGSWMEKGEYTAQPK